MCAHLDDISEDFVFVYDEVPRAPDKDNDRNETDDGPEKPSECSPSISTVHSFHMEKNGVQLFFNVLLWGNRHRGRED